LCKTALGGSKDKRKDHLLELPWSSLVHPEAGRTANQLVLVLLPLLLWRPAVLPVA
jgi:hypothetical protein